LAATSVRSLDGGPQARGLITDTQKGGSKVFGT
jgi:hypothetical protein